jgi:acetyl esterase
MVVAGSSAGGNLAAAVALHARDQGSPSLAFQVLIYPVIDSSMTSASYQLDTSGTLLDRDQMAWYWNQYVPDQQDKKNPLASPAHSLSLKGLPPAYVITAEFDPLRDEGEEYARRLRADGVDVISTRYDGQIHGFMGLLGIVSDANTALNDLCLFLRDRLSS